MGEKIYSEDIAEAVEQFLKEKGWHYRFNDELGTFTKRFRADDNSRLDVSIDIYHSSIMVCAVYDKYVKPNDKRAISEMSEFICRANNYALMERGCFLFDPESGEISYRTYTDCGDTVPGRKTIRNIIYAPLEAFDCFRKSLNEIISEGITAHQAITRLREQANEEITSALKEENKPVTAGDNNGGNKPSMTELTNFLVRLLADRGNTDHEPEEDDDEEILNMNIFEDEDE